MDLLLDEMLPRSLAEALRKRGHDVVAVTERPGLRGLPDVALFEAAQAETRAVATYNRDDYLELDAVYRRELRSHAGVVIVNPKRFPEGVPATFGRLIRSFDALLAADAPWPSFVHWLQ